MKTIKLPAPVNSAEAAAPPAANHATPGVQVVPPAQTDPTPGVRKVASTVPPSAAAVDDAAPLADAPDAAVPPATTDPSAPLPDDPTWTARRIEPIHLARGELSIVVRRGTPRPPGEFGAAARSGVHALVARVSEAMRTHPAVLRVRTLHCERDAVARRVAVARARLDEAEAKKRRVAAEAKAGFADELVKLTADMARLRDGLAAAEQAAAELPPLLAEAEAALRKELAQAQTRQRSEIRAAAKARVDAALKEIGDRASAAVEEFVKADAAYQLLGRHDDANTADVEDLVLRTDAPADAAAEPPKEPAS